MQVTQYGMIYTFDLCILCFTSAFSTLILAISCHLHNSSILASYCMSPMRRYLHVIHDYERLEYGFDTEEFDNVFLVIKVDVSDEADSSFPFLPFLPQPKLPTKLLACCEKLTNEDDPLT